MTAKTGDMSGVASIKFTWSSGNTLTYTPASDEAVQHIKDECSDWFDAIVSRGTWNQTMVDPSPSMRSADGREFSVELEVGPCDRRSKRSLRLDIVAKLLRELPADQSIWTYNGRVYTAGELLLSAEAGEHLGERYVLDLLRRARDSLQPGNKTA